MKFMDEFALIRTLLAPLARDFPGSLNLRDDAALLRAPEGCELVVTKDAMCAGVHFFPQDDAGLIAKKLLRVNLSDLAAKGAAPLCYFMALMLPRDTDNGWYARFAEGLRDDQAHYGIHLAGGDTTATPGLLALSLTAVGSVKQGAALLRSGARAGDRIYVSGTLGDAALGLAVLQETLNVSPLHSLWLKERYYLPQPRMALGAKLHGIAHACMDVSDGLVQDLGHICTASGVGAVIHRHRLPLSEAALSVLQENEAWWHAISSGGDDYELLFTVPHNMEDELQALAQQLLLPLTCIGDIVPGSDVQLLDEHGQDATPAQGGYRHF